MLKKIQLILYIIALMGFIAVCTILHSSWVVVLNSLLGLTTIFLLSQGYILGNIIGILQLITYCYLTITNRIYGELVEIFLITLPAYIFSFYTWGKSSNSNILKPQKNISTKNWCIVVSISTCLSLAMYFVFNAFGTQSLIFSTIIFGINCVSGYLKVKRVKYTFVFNLAAYAVSLAMWSVFAFNGDLSYLPVMLNYVVYIVFCVLGLFNWTKIGKAQTTN